MLQNTISAIWFVFLTFIGCSGNLLVIYTVATNRRLHLKRYFFPASLAMSDLLLVVSVFPFRSVARWQEHWSLGMTWCQGSAFILRLSYVVTIAHLCAVSYDRYRAIVKNPLLYQSDITKRVILQTALFLWILPTAFSVGSLAALGEFPYNTKTYVCEQDWEVPQKDALGAFFDSAIGVSCFVLPLIVIIALNCVVLKTARKQSKTVRAAPLQPTTSNRERKRMKKILAEHRAAIDVAIIIGVFLLCYLPAWITGALRRLMQKQAEVPVEVYLTTQGIFMSSAVWNPFIFSFRKREFKKAMFSLVRCRRNSINTTVQGMPQTAFTGDGSELYAKNQAVNVGRPAVYMN